MARVNLRCTSCGYHFSVNDTETSKPGGAKCPSCLAPVGVNGPVEGGPKPKTVRVLAAAPGTGALKMKIMIGAAAAVLVIAVAAVVLLMGGSRPPEEKQAAIPKRPTPAAAPKKEPRPAEKTAPASKPASTTKVDETTTLNTPGVPPGETVPHQPSTPAQPQATVPGLPEDLLKTLKEEVLSLKVWHLNLVVSGPEKTRLDALLAAGKGAPEDVEFLKGILTGPRLRAVKEEVVMIRDTRARLEPEAMEGLPIDLVTMNDGRPLNGRIIDETPEMVMLERKIGAGSLVKMPLKKADIKQVQKGKGVGGEFKTRWEAAKKGGSPALLPVLAWCKENTLALQASLTAYTILVDDPGRSEARQEAGLATDPVARWQEAEKQGGFITYEGRRWVPRELKDKLIRDGYALVDGKWLKGTPRIVSVPSLFRYENQNVKPVQIGGNLANDEVVTYNILNGQEKADIKAMRRFYAATQMTVSATKTKLNARTDVDQWLLEDKGAPPQGSAMKGEVYITVPLNAPILEASVMTLAEVKSGAIAVSLLADGRRIQLYRCQSKEDSSHKLPEEIRGKREVQLVAEITGAASYVRKPEEKKVITRGKKDSDRVIERASEIIIRQLVPEYPAVLFPSNANTIEVFRLTVTTGEEAPQLDALFQNAAEVLKK